jgi:hypothetical protein
MDKFFIIIDLKLKFKINKNLFEIIFIFLPGMAFP